MKYLGIFLVIIILTFTFIAPVAQAETEGKELFAIHCAGCHPQGGNIIRRGKTLKAKALQKYGMDNLEAIAAIITNGKNNMSAYGDRLTTAEINTLANYVLEQSQQDWRASQL